MTPDASSPVEPAVPEDVDSAVLEELKRVLASATFRGSDHSRSLLSFVVTEALAGRGDRLSAILVGRGGTQPGEAPTLAGLSSCPGDAAAQVAAHRNAGERTENPVRIELPPGGYTPIFTLGPSPSRSLTSSRWP